MSRRNRVAVSDDTDGSVGVLERGYSCCRIPDPLFWWRLKLVSDSQMIAEIRAQEIDWKNERCLGRRHPVGQEIISRGRAAQLYL